MQTPIYPGQQPYRQVSRRHWNAAGGETDGGVTTIIVQNRIQATEPDAAIVGVVRFPAHSLVVPYRRPPIRRESAHSAGPNRKNRDASIQRIDHVTRCRRQFDSRSHWRFTL